MDTTRSTPMLSARRVGGVPDVASRSSSAAFVAVMKAV
jgi:hypothetical protein